MDSKELMAGKLVAHMLENDIRALRTENAALKEQITNAKYSYLGAMADCKRYEETIAQQAEAIRMKDAVLNRIMLNGWGLWALTDIAEALAVQPSPEILQARDKRVAEACAKAVIAYNGQCDAHVLASQLICGEWRKHL